MLGIEQVIVVLNKIDLVRNDQEKFEGVEMAVLDFLGSIGVNSSLVIPISGILILATMS